MPFRPSGEPLPLNKLIEMRLCPSDERLDLGKCALDQAEKFRRWPRLVTSNKGLERIARIGNIPTFSVRERENLQAAHIRFLEVPALIPDKRVQMLPASRIQASNSGLSTSHNMHHDG